MSAKTIKSALGLLQDDPDHAEAWEQLRTEIAGDPGMQAAELLQLLDAARRAHDGRREVEPAARILELEVLASRGAPEEIGLLGELGRVLDEEVLDDARAKAVYERLLELRPDDAQAAEHLERAAAKRSKWRDLVERYLHEANGAGEPPFRSSLLVSAAETVYRFGRIDGKLPKPEVEQTLSILRDALALDAKNRRAELLLERMHREEGRWEELARAIEQYADEATQKEEKTAAWQRLARVFAKKIGSPERAVAAFERVIDFSPADPEATNFLVDFFTSHGMWDHLVALYEGQLATGALRAKEEELGALLQVAMVHWRMRGHPEVAEPWFERVRKLEPAHPGMLSFFRELYAARGDNARLAAILSDAQRAVPEGPERAAIVAEVAKLSEEGANAQKAIEQWRTVLRQDPRSSQARDALKRLYRQTASWSALTDLLRQELEKLPPEDTAGRLALLRDVAQVYRDHVRSDSALVTVLSQIVQLDGSDLASVRELVRVYEALQRWRDLLTMQAKQAELEPETGVKVELWRAIARRWQEQFSNVQNAVESYEKLNALDPRDRESVERLKELYAKRRAYKPLYDLLGREAEMLAPGPARRELWTEMARLAAERLDMGPQAVAWYKRVLEEDPSSSASLDALEKQAERDKDFATVAEVLERRAVVAGDDASRLAVLQKLGTIYSERLHDHAKAKDAWRRVLALQPGHAKALRVLRDSLLAGGDFDGLTELYAATGDWEGLVEVLSGAADRATDPPTKIDLSFRCAAIYEDKLKTPERAFRAYERVLSVKPDDVTAAAALVPLYEKDEKWGRLPALYEVLLGHAEDVDRRLELLAKLADVTGHQLQDRVTAFQWARKAYELAPEREGALAALERAARAASQWAAFVEVISGRLAALEVPSEPAKTGSKKKKKKERERERENGDASGRRDEARVLKAKLAEVYAREMGRVDEAVATYRGLVSEDESDELAVQTIDRVLREADRREDLRWLFELRVERANTALKIDLLSEWAMLEEEAFGAPDRAVGLYRRMLELVPSHGGALRALARLLRSQGDAQGAVEVIALDRDQRQGAERAAREVEIARLLVEPLQRYKDALDACERALALTPNDSDGIAVVELLLPFSETRVRAAGILERAYDAKGDPRRQSEVLEVLIAATPAKEDRLALYARLAEVDETKLGDPSAAFAVVARAVNEFPVDLALWDRLAVLAAKSGRTQALVDAIVAVVPPTGASSLPPNVELDLAERAATLLDEKLGELDSARPYLERMLGLQPANDRAFQRLKQILTTREQWDQLAALYEQVVAATTDPARRAELLAEVALVAEDITGDKARAIAYYERILDLDPRHEHASKALDSLYAAEQRWAKLAELLERRLEGAAGEERTDLEQRLGTLFFEKLSDPARSLGYLERVLLERVSAAEARRLVEKILDVPPLRERAAIVLESVYAARDDVAELVRALEIHLEFVTQGEERRGLLGRVAQLRDERLRDDPGALEAYARLLPLDPDDTRARHRLLDIARRTGASERAASVLVAAVAHASAPVPKAEILMDLAKLFENQLSDVARAESVYRELLELAPDDASIALPPCRALEQIYAASGDNRRLADVLRVQVGLESDADARRELRGRLGELCERALDDAAGAIQAWRARLEDDPADLAALAALDRLYEGTQSWRELVEVLRARERLAEDKAARRAFMVRVAITLATKLNDVTEAILAYRTVIDDFGADRTSLAALVPLYESAERWQDLADVLEADLALAESAAEKLPLLARLGEVRKKRLGDHASAIETYRQALVLDPAHAPSRDALEAMLEDPTARREAAVILRPLYEAEGRNDSLLKVLDIEAEHAESVPDKLQTIAQAAQVAENALGDTALAFEYASRGLRESVAELDLPAWIERAERLAAAAGKFPELVELLRSAVGDILDGDVQLEVMLQIAELARTHLGDLAVAKQFYAKALDLRGDDRRALVALESLYEETGEQASLLEVIKRRVDASADDEEKKQLLFKQARLSDEKLGDARGAMAVYEQILEGGLELDAVAALERLYAAADRWEDLVSLYERQIAAAETSAARQAELHHALGDVLDARLHETERAFDEYAAALAIDPRHPETVASLEALLARRDHAVRAAEMLEPVYVGRLDWRRVMSTLEARLEASQDPDDRRQILRRLSTMHEEQEENYGAALEITAKLLTEDPTDETTWSELERLARVANAEGRLAEIYAGELGKITTDEPATARLAQRTGQLFEAQGDVDRALEFYRRAYAFDPAESGATFEAIDRLLRQAGRPRDRVQLYREALEYRTGPQDRLATLHTIAGLEESELKDDSAAIETYRAAIDVDEGDARSLEALARLLARTERWRDLADLTRRRAEQSALADDEARFRMELAQLLLEKLSDAQSAVDELQTVVGLVSPGAAGPGAEAVKALERVMQSAEHKARVVEILRPIYEQADNWRQMVAVNVERLGLANDAGDRVAILRETAQLWEERGRNTAKAFDAIRQAWALDPEDGETREQLDRLAGLTKRWDDLADAYEQAVATAEGLTKRELLAALARLHDSKRDDLRKALDAWERLFSLDPSELQPLEEMDALATLLSDWTTLVRVLTRKADLLPDDESRATTWRRLGEARRDMLDDFDGAIVAYERALEIEPDSTETLDQLIALQESKGDAARLVELYRKRVELSGSGDDALRFELLVKAARLFEADLSDRREAIECLSNALAVRSADVEVLRGLDRLYTQERLWPELLENLKLQASVAPDDDAKRTLKKRIAALYMDELQEPQSALEVYREVLGGGFDAEAVAAIRTIGEAQDDLRAEAAEALEPVLRQTGRHAELADVLELKLRAQTEAIDRARTLRSLAEVAERDLGDGRRAEAALLRALVEEPHADSLHADVERLAAQSGVDGWRRYADALSERANSIFDAAVAADLFVRLGRAAEDKLDDPSRAAAAYAAAAERLGDDANVLAALDRLFAKLGDSKSLADVLERRIGIEPQAAAQVELLYRLAKLQIEQFGDKAQGLATLRKALDRVPDHAGSRAELEKLLEDDALFEEAFEALESVLRTLALSADLAKLYERRVGRAHSPRDRTRARLELARVLEESVKDRAQAQKALEAAVREDPADEDALSALERLAADNHGWEAAAEALAAALDAVTDLPAPVRSELWVRLAGWCRDKVHDLVRAEGAFVKALEMDAENLDVLRALEELRRAPGRERELVATLRKRARLETDLATKRELLREAKTFAEGPVGDRALAEATLRDLLEEDEGDLWALEELTKLRRESGDETEAVRLLMRRAELVTDGRESLRLKYEAAQTLVDKLNDLPRATALYEEILDIEPADTSAASALRALYGRAGRDKDLAKLLSRLVDTAESPAQRAALRLELAKLYETRFHAAEDAIEVLRAVLDEDATQGEAVMALSQLYESTGRDAELADLLRAQLDAARERGDVGVELAILVRLGEVQESRLNDVAAAQETYELVLARDPAHRGALEAIARMSEKRADWERASGALSSLLGLATDAAGVALALRLAEARDKLKDPAGAEDALQRGLRLEPSNAGLRAMLRVRWEREEKWADLAALLVGDADLIAATTPDPANAAPPPAPQETRKSNPPSMIPPAPVSPKLAEQVKLLRRAAEIHQGKRKQPTDAIPLLERAAKLVPNDRELLLALCDAYNESQRGREAAQVLEKVIASFGNKRTKELALYHHRLARALAQLGDKDVALSQLDMAFKIDPGSVSVLKDLGVLAFETNDLERAQKTFRALLLQRLDAGTGISKGEVFCYLGEISIKQGDKAKAVQMFERAVENDPALERARTKLSELKS